MERFDAAILAAGRLSDREAERAGVRIKALVQVGESTPLAAVIAALRAARAVNRVIVVGPAELRSASNGVDEWVDERATGEENVLAGLRAATTRRAIVSASDVPFVRAEYIDDFLSRVPSDADFAYPVYERAEFLRMFPHGRSRFARIRTGCFTGGSLCLMNVAVALRNHAMIRRAFAARRSQLAMASLLGADCVIRHVAGRLEIGHIEQRLGRLTGGRAVAVRGAHPALAMDCDSAEDIEYVRSNAERWRPA